MDQQELQPYLNILPQFIVVFLAALLATPLIGSIAMRLGLVDQPQEKRKRTDKSLSTRIHHTLKIRAGGLAVLIPFIIVAFSVADHDSRLLGLITGLIVLIIGGILDDRYELSAKKQMLIQLLAAVIAVVSGVTIARIDVAGQTFNFSLWTHEFNFGIFKYLMTFPADLFSVVWILGIMNAINWMSGIDAIGELTTFIAAFTTMLLSVRAGQPEIAILSATLAAGLLGFVPFNFPPSKIMSGTAGTTGYGFILAIFAVISGSKITSAITLLSLPIIDMVWVMGYRFIKLKDVPFFKRPFVSGDVHLHHRLMALGLNQVQTLFLEVSLISLISLVAFYFGGFSNSFMCPVIVIALLIIIFTVISLLTRRQELIRSRKPVDGPPQPPIVDSGPTPEEKYAY
jgi:UDP-GlcNAc:undecaprenyl-phosphate/decaprenyl-phosphate GlcNAc-1-phosphate transferase